MIVVMLFFPAGLVGLPRLVRRIILKRRGIIEEEPDTHGPATA